MTQILKSMNPINIISQKDGAKRTAIMFFSILLMGFSVSVFSYSRLLSCNGLLKASLLQLFLGIRFEICVFRTLHHYPTYDYSTNPKFVKAAKSGVLLPF